MKRCPRRDAAAVTEFALVAPLLALIAMAAIDVGQSINVAQVVNDASREGARQASRMNVSQVSDVQAVVQTYVGDAFPNLPPENLAAALTVDVDNSMGPVPAGDLTTIQSGSSVSVKVNFQFDAVRWTAFLPGFDGISMETTTVMRRE